MVISPNYFYKQIELKTFIFKIKSIFRSNATVAIKSRTKEGVDRSAPSFARPMGDVAVDEGQKLRITTPVKGNPIPGFSWTKDGAALEGDRVHFFSDGELVRILA